MTKLSNAYADIDPSMEIFALITPAFYAYLTDLPSFASADYVQDKRFEGTRKDKAFTWWGVTWIVDAGLPGAGTASASCFMYAKSAIGHAMHFDGIETEIGYDGKQAKSWARATGHFGSKLLQNSGVVEMTHNDSAYS